MKVKQKYVDILLRITPGPIGRGMTIKTAAKDLGISCRTIKYKLTQFKKNYPEAWGNFKKLRELARQDRYKLRWKRHPNQEIGLKLFSELE